MRGRLHKNETGLASLVIAILIVIVVTTLVLGFMQIISREQRRTLDNQLSSQAYYAAESGVNDAVKAIQEFGYKGGKTTCAPLTASASPTPPPPISASVPNSNYLTPDGNVQYSCLLIDPTPISIEYDQVDTSHSVLFPIESTGGSEISNIKFEWESATSNLNPRGPSGVSFPPSADWKSIGVLRIDLVAGSSLQRGDLIDKSRTYFVYPNQGAGSSFVNFGDTSKNGAIINGKCGGGSANKKHVCKVVFNNIPSGRMYARIMAVYSPIKVTVSAVGLDGTTPIKFVGAQSDIDATGKAADVLRRIRVRVPMRNMDLPDAAIVSMSSLCKKFGITSPSVGQPANTVAENAVIEDANCNPYASP